MEEGLQHSRNKSQKGALEKTFAQERGSEATSKRPEVDLPRASLELKGSAMIEDKGSKG